MRALRLGALVLVVAALAVAVLTGVTPDVARLRDWAAAAGPAAPLAFAVVCAAGSVALVPKPVLSVAGGVAFGPVLGAVVVVAGVTAGAVASFAVARALGRDAVRDRLRRGRFAAVDAALERRGVWAVIGLRLLPVVPFGAVNYAAGLSGLRVGAFALGTAVGVVPATLVYTTTGSSLGSMSPAGWALAGAAVALPALVGFAVARRAR
ncbi:TVP38/TMEM64 family protein [Saccharothrix coeruleofusca]|uniref:TVP38/TMEM64 family membrane protein n=1 Tax=Saccharothrix coeruleofusca TaxID=33919 RepID=A0A918EH99_9PSEU|nr:VTT domain-containing protein [Saccharothrix coeruleofusca]MBP2335419.1 putative membrane protein YdjX (TVP38/TMEM64 family) [Saccharothrix coeruleofusca]GGP77692.1 TVP38/TMEM64 family protein [Saccharothrix coeruleofusca]